MTGDRGIGADPAALLALLDQDSIPLSSAGRPVQSRTDRWMRYLGFPGGIAVFLTVLCAPLGPGLSGAAQAGLASFLLALVWWVTEPVPTYLTSLALMFLLLMTRAAPAKPILDVLGLEVIWLNLLAFILSAMLVKTRLARRVALALVLRFGASARWALFAFVLIQLVLAPLIPATAARTVMTLPLMVVVAAIYGSTETHPNAFGKHLLLLNLIGISVLSSMSMTGSSANLIAVGLIETMGGRRLYYVDWMRLGAPIAITTVVLMWWLGQRWLFPMAPAERAPQLPGGLALVREKYHALGPLSVAERKAAAIFALVLGLWMTDVFHARWFGVEIAAPFAALAGVLVALFPRWGVLTWAEAEVPWHLLIFSAGAYAGGLALDDTGAAEWAVRNLFGRFDLGRLPFGAAYAVIVGVMLYSHLLTTSKTVRTMIMLPIIITAARTLGWDPVSLALPAALTIDWVVGLPISGKPNVILFSTNQYTVSENFRYGFATCTVGFLLLIGSGATWFHWIGITPAFSAVPAQVDAAGHTPEPAAPVRRAAATVAHGALTYAVTHTDAAAADYEVTGVIPDGMRAVAIREALPKPRAGEAGPRARLTEIEGRPGVRLQVGHVVFGETVSLKVELGPARMPWGWPVAGVLLSALYLRAFRDLVPARRRS